MFLPSIDLNVSEKLRRDPEFRQRFFVAESSAEIARQLIALRKRRGLSQAQLAERLGTQQPAISRVESADYRNWSYNTLRKEAEVLDARLRVLIQAAEDVLIEYETEAGEQHINKETWTTNVLTGLNQRVFGSPSALMLDENAKIRKENDNLKEEIARLKSALLLCNPLPASQDRGNVARAHAALFAQSPGQVTIPRGTSQEQRIGA